MSSNIDECSLSQCRIWLIDGIIDFRTTQGQPPFIGAVTNLTFTDEDDLSFDCTVSNLTPTRWKLLDTYGFPFQLREFAFFAKSDDGYDLGYTWVSNDDLQDITLGIKEETYIDVCWALKVQDEQPVGTMSFRMCIIPQSGGEDNLELYTQAMNHLHAENLDLLAETLLLARESKLQQLLLHKCGKSLVRRFTDQSDGAADIRQGILILGLATQFDEQTGGIPQHAQDLMAAESQDGELLRESYEELMTAFALSFELDDSRLDHLSFSICIGQHLIDLPYTNARRKLSLILTNLGHSFWRRFQAGTSQTLQDITESMFLHRKAINELPFPEHDDLYPDILFNLGQAILTHFLHTSSPELLSKGSEVLQQAVELTPVDHPKRPLRLTVAATALIRRSGRSGNTSYILEAIDLRNQAIKLLPPNHPFVPGLLSGLGQCWHRLYQDTKCLDDISKAIQYQRESVHLAEILPRKTNMFKLRDLLSEYGTSLATRYLVTLSNEDFREADDAFRRALSLMVHGDIGRPITMLHYTVLHFTRFIRFPEETSVTELLDVMKLINASPSGTAVVRVMLTSVLASVQRLAALSLSTPQQTLTTYASVIDMLPQLASFEQTVEVRHHQIARVGRTVIASVAEAIKCNEIGLAVEWMERVRCWVWNQLNQLRMPLNGVREHNPQLADQLERISQELDRLGSRSMEKDALAELPTADAVHQQVVLAKKWDETIAEVRTIPGLSDFLRPPTIASLLASIPEDGPVVLLNVDLFRCDALVLVPRNDEPLLVPLAATTSELEKLQKDLYGYLSFVGARSRNSEDLGSALADRGARPRPQKGVLATVLRYLWTHIVKPILDALAYSPSHKTRHRIWWCPSGPLSFLPLHAAGEYNRSSCFGHCLPDYAISSYIPTVGGLIEKSQRPAPLSSDPTSNRLLLVSQADAPGLPSIPATSEEVRRVAACVLESSTEVTMLEGSNATVDAVKMCLQSHSSIHLACHGIQNPYDPLKSSFFLRDGQLDLSQIIREHTPHADFAFLSACQTCSGDQTLPEEMVHLAAGVLAAGYRRIVATMWSIKDAYGPVLAQDFYGHLVQEGKGLETGESAAALHTAVGNLRQMVGDSEDGLLAWVPYVHFGA